MNRRRFLKAGAGGVALITAGQLTQFATTGAHAADATGFLHGVASGDPLPDGIIIWTRVTPTGALVGSGLGPPTPVTYEIASDTAFATVAERGVVVSNATSDHTIKVDARGLASDTEYWYRFSALGTASPVGRFRTAPAAGATVDSLRFGVVSCSNWEAGYYAPYRFLAGRDLDYVLELGDYIYEYESGFYTASGTVVRPHQPVNEIVTLADYRVRHACTKTDPDLQALHQRYAWVSIWDDHEIADNSWSGGAIGHQPATEGPYGDRKAAAHRAYYEWMPVRNPGHDADWRRFSFGSIADLFMLDERSDRSKQVPGAYEVDGAPIGAIDPGLDDPDRTMLGATQKQWLADGLKTSKATWKLLGNGVIFSPLLLTPDLPAEITAPLNVALALAGASLPVAFNPDQWDGYRVEQHALRDTIGGGINGVVFLTGDVHSSFGAEVPADPSTYPVTGDAVAVEFVTPSISAQSIQDTLDVAFDPIGPEFGAATLAGFQAGNSWYKYIDLARHGVGVFEVTAMHAHYDWWYTSDRTKTNATMTFGAGYESVLGSNTVLVATQLAERAPRPSGAQALPATGTIPATGSNSAAPLESGAALAAAAVVGHAIAASSEPKDAPNQPENG